MKIAVKNANLRDIKQRKKILVKILLGIVIILSFSSVLLTLSPVQTKLGTYATKWLKKNYEVDITIKKLNLGFLGKIQLKSIRIDDHKNDTLIYIENLTTSVVSYKNFINNNMEFGSIHLDGFRLKMKTYEGETNDNLNIFVEKFGKSDPDKPSSFKLYATDVLLHDGYVEIVDENQDVIRPLYFNDINGIADNLKIEGPNVSVYIKDVGFIENHNIEVMSLSTHFDYTLTAMNFLKTVLKTEKSELRGDIHFNYKRSDLADFNNKVQLTADITDATLAMVDLQKFYYEFGTNDVLDLSTRVSGTLNNLLLEDLDLVSKQDLVVDGTLYIKNAMNSEDGFWFKGEFNELSSNYEQLKQLLPNLLGNSLPQIIKDLGEITIKGTTVITENVIDAQMEMNTDLGTTISDLKLTNITDINKASYAGDIEIIDFDLGVIMKDSLVGQLSMKAKVEGKGFDLESINTNVVGTVSKHQYKGYTYGNISINGQFLNKRFNGEMEVNDPNIKLNFKGLADLASDVYTFDFKTHVDYCEINKLNLFKRDSIAVLKGVIDIKMRGNTIDDVVGAINFQNTSYNNHKDNFYFKDFTISASFKDQIRTIAVNSNEIINGRVRGKFRIAQLGKLAINSIGNLYSNYTPYHLTPGQFLDFRFKIHHKIVEVFYPEINLASNTLIRGEINADENLFKLSVKSPQISVYNYLIKKINLQIDTKNPLFNTHLYVGDISADSYRLSELNLLNKTKNDTLFFKTELLGGKEQTESFKIDFYHTIDPLNNSVFGLQKSMLNLKKNNWTIDAGSKNENRIVYNNSLEELVFENFSLKSKGQEIKFHGTIKDSTTTDVTFDFKNVKLAEITPHIDSLRISGLLNGRVRYLKTRYQLRPTVELTVNDFEINSKKQGDLKVQIAGDNSIKKFKMYVSLDLEDSNTLKATGDLDFSSKKASINSKVEFNEFDISAFSPLGGEVLTNIRGFLYGEATLTGPISNFDMQGELFFDQAGIYFPYLNVDYDFSGTSVIELEKQTFKIIDVLLEDKKHKSQGYLTGKISHNNFETWELDLDIETKNLLILDTQQEENSLFFGTGFIAGKAKIYGPTTKLVIDVNAKTMKKTNFVVPISDVKTISDTEVFRFVNKNGENQDEKEKTRAEYLAEKLKGLSMNFNIEVTKDAMFEMVLDKTTGSYLKGRGTGFLQINLDTKNKFEMYGDYAIDNGKYNFKYLGITKPFAVKRGGTISWSGDPLAANINIEAVYRVQANPRTFLENITSSRKIPVDLITRFSGELFDSQKEFDIEIPNSSSTVSSELELKLKRNGENDRTLQFMSLLIANSFYNEDLIGSAAGSAAAGTSADILSNLLQDVLNDSNSKFKLTPSYIVGDKNRVDSYNTDDQLGVAVEYQIGNRVIVNGKALVPVGTKQQTDVIGEANAEFLLNEEGNMRLSVFNRQNEIQYTSEEEGYTQGIGFNYSIDFDNGKELLQKLGLKKKLIVKDTLNGLSEKDSIRKNRNIFNFIHKKK